METSVIQSDTINQLASESDTGTIENRKITLQDIDDAFCNCFHQPDVGALHVALATYAANLLPGDPVWTLFVAGASWGKTEVVAPLGKLKSVHEASTLTVASLLSGVPKKEWDEESSGGLLRLVGPQGVIVAKDFTSVLSMKQEARTELLAAMREIYDGSYSRHLGSNGGQSLSWKGKMGFVGACTEAIDLHHAVMAQMGPRFLLYRYPPLDEIGQAEMAIASSGSERGMREYLGNTVREFFDSLQIPSEIPPLSPQDVTRLAHLSRLAARSRSAVERNAYTREVEHVHAFEAPARLGRELTALLCGLRIIGVPEDAAWDLVVKVALDSIPKVRRQVFDVVAAAGAPLTTDDVAAGVAGPSTQTIRRALEDLNLHKVLLQYSQGVGRPTYWELSDMALEDYRYATGRG